MKDSSLLASPFLVEEVKSVFFFVDLFKTSGPDRYPACFYQKAWKVVGQSMVGMVLDVLQGGHIPSGIYEILITFILKVQGSESISQFRPISMCNVTYKAITKVLVNHMKRVIPSLISPNQCSFIPGRQFHDNVIIL